MAHDRPRMPPDEVRDPPAVVSRPALSALEQYAIAIALVALATLCRGLFDWLLGDRTPFVFYFLAVIIAAWAAGFGPGMVATVGCAIAARLFFSDPRFAGPFYNLRSIAPSIVFIALGAILSWLVSRWRSAERALVSSRDEARLRAERLEFQATLLEQAYDAVFVRDANQRVTLWNAGAERLYGWTAEEIIGRNAHELLDTPETTRAAFTEALARGSWSGQIRHRHRNGAEVVSDSRQVRLASGHVLEVNRDITERVDAERALRASEQTLKALLDASTESIWMIDRERVLVANATAADRLGLAIQDVIGAPWRTLFPEDVARIRGEKAEQVFATGQPVRFEDERSGIRFDHVFYPACDANGEVSAVAAFSRDVTQQRRREDELREVSQRLADHVNHSPLAVIQFGPDMRITRWTGSAERLFGWAAAEVVGKRIEDFRWVYEEDRERVSAVSASLQSGSDPRRFSANRNYRKDGTVIVCEWYNSSLVDEWGRLRSVLSLVLDVTSRTRLEQELRSQTQQLVLANRLKDDFLATLSHELRTPINAILGWAQILAMAEYSPERFRRGIETITRNARLQARMVEDLLDVSRIVTGSVRLELQNLELLAIVEQALDAIRPGAEAKQLTVTSQVPVGLKLSADPVRLQQVLFNLLSNAVKFTPPGGRVSVAADVAGTDVSIAVADTGIGIPANFVPHVFERFRQADSSPTREHGGLGLGLAIVRHIVELHGGSVSVHSPSSGQGSLFTVRLPLRTAREAGPPPIRPARQTDPRPLHNVHILVVDDEPDTREMLATLLAAAGARVDTADSADAAIARLTAFTPDVLVSDIAMPGIDGYHFIRQLRHSTPSVAAVPAVALTAYGGATAKDSALDAGFDAYLAKPVEADALIATIASMLAPRA